MDDRERNGRGRSNWVLLNARMGGGTYEIVGDVS